MRCPICDAGLTSLDNAALNAHLDACLGQPPPTRAVANGPAAASGAKRGAAAATVAQQQQQQQREEAERRIKQQRTLMASWMGRLERSSEQ